jgi:predicted DNA-binding protein YlxM (UPF0122 family)
MNLKRPRNIYYCLKQRCANPRNKSFKYYGGRGITYPKKWDSFFGFWDDMKDGYRDDLTIDRINTDGNYSKKNCRWITMTEQLKNRKYRSYSDKQMVPRPIKKTRCIYTLSDKNKKRDQEIIDLYKSGKSIIFIGEEYGISKQRVSQILTVHRKNLHLLTNNVYSTVMKKKTIDITARNKAIKYLRFVEELSLREIALIFNISRTMVLKALK